MKNSYNYNENNLWEALDSNILDVVDEHGANMNNAQVRHLLGTYWLYVDDQDGYSILHESRVEELRLVPENQHRDYAR